MQYGENLTRCFETLKPLMVVLKPPLTEPSIDDIIDLVRFFPSNLSIDPHILHAEFSNFVPHVNLVKKNSVLSATQQTLQKSGKRFSLLQIDATIY